MLPVGFDVPAPRVAGRHSTAAALMALKKKKLYETQLEQVENNILRVNEQQVGFQGPGSQAGRQGGSAGAADAPQPPTGSCPPGLGDPAAARLPVKHAGAAHKRARPPLAVVFPARGQQACAGWGSGAAYPWQRMTFSPLPAGMLQVGLENLRATVETVDALRTGAHAGKATMQVGNGDGSWGWC